MSVFQVELKKIVDDSYEIEVGRKLTEKLAKDGYDPKFGARPLRRLIQSTVEDTMSEELLKGHIKLGQEIRLTVKGDEIVPVGAKNAEKPAAKKPAAKKPAAKKPTAKKPTDKKPAAKKPAPKKPAAKKPVKKVAAKKEEKPVG